MRDKISVVVTVLNEERNIKKLVNSLLSQTRKSDEIIIVDGNQSGNTVNKVSKHKEIQMYIKEGNRSVGRNYGISKARGNIIAVTDAGGFPGKKWLERITKPFTNRNVAIVSGYYKSLAKTSFERCVTPYFLVMPDKAHDGMEFLPSSRSVAFRKSVWEKVGGYPERYSHNEDLVFDYSLKRSGVNFYFEPKAIVYWHPPKSLGLALKQMYRFALGDAESGINRPKTKYIFLRYLMGFLLLLLQQYQFFVLCSVFYVLYCVQKNLKYAKMIEALFWLPVIQVGSDIAVMIGHTRGKIVKAKL